MNKISLLALIIVLIYYFGYYLPQQKTSPDLKLTHNQSTQNNLSEPAFKSTQTQTSLSDKQISLLTQQWNQVALWAQEQGIDTNKSWNLTSLKNKLKKDLETAKNQSLKVQYSRSTQTDNLPSTNPDPDQAALEKTLTNLIASMQKLNQEIK